jgi:hypothetical protein
MKKWIELAEAFRERLRARHPEHAAIAHEITSYDWFSRPVLSIGSTMGGGTVTINGPLGSFEPDSVPRIPCDGARYDAANKVLSDLERDIKEGRIALRGELRRDQPPVDIDPIDCARGSVHVFGGTLAVGFDRVYRHVYCSVNDLALEHTAGDCPDPASAPTSVAPRKAIPLDDYEKYQRDTKKNTGHYASQATEERWGAGKGYSVESLRAARKKFVGEKLSEAEQDEFSKPGPRKRPR